MHSVVGDVAESIPVVEAHTVAEAVYLNDFYGYLTVSREDVPSVLLDSRGPFDRTAFNCVPVTYFQLSDTYPYRRNAEGYVYVWEPEQGAWLLVAHAEAIERGVAYLQIHPKANVNGCPVWLREAIEARRPPGAVMDVTLLLRLLGGYPADISSAHLMLTPTRGWTLSIKADSSARRIQSEDLGWEQKQRPLKQTSLRPDLREALVSKCHEANKVLGKPDGYGLDS